MNKNQLTGSANPTEVGVAIAAGMALGEVRKNPHPEGRDFVVLQDKDGGFKVEHLERPTAPFRKKGTVRVNDVESFIAATQRFTQENLSVIYASLTPAQFLTVLNDHHKSDDADHADAGWRDHRVHFVLAHSAEWTVWAQHDGKPFKGQEEFAYFVENNLPDFKNPAGARMLDMALNFRATKEISYKGGTRLQNGSVQLDYNEVVQGSAGPQGKIVIPEEFTIAIPVWAGLDQEKYELEARFRYRIGGGQLSIWYDLNRPQKVAEQAFKDTVETIEKSLGKTPIIFGTPE